MAVLGYAPPGYGCEYGLHASPANADWQRAFCTQPDVAVRFIQGRARKRLARYVWHWSHSPDAVGQADFEIYACQFQKPGALRGGFMHVAPVWEDMALLKAWGGARGAAQCPKMTMRACADQLTGTVIPGAGRWLAEEQPGLPHAALLDFLGRSAEGRWPEVPRWPQRRDRPGGAKPRALGRRCADQAHAGAPGRRCCCRLHAHVDVPDARCRHDRCRPRSRTAACVF